MHVQRWLHRHRDLAEAAHVQAVCIQTRRLYEGSLCQATCMDMGCANTCREALRAPRRYPDPCEYAPENQRDDRTGCRLHHGKHGALPRSDTLTAWRGNRRHGQARGAQGSPGQCRAGPAGRGSDPGEGMNSPGRAAPPAAGGALGPLSASGRDGTETGPGRRRGGGSTRRCRCCPGGAPREGAPRRREGLRRAAPAPGRARQQLGAYSRCRSGSCGPGDSFPLRAL